MKVAIINHSDTRGGASVVALRLTAALAALGVDATMVVARKETHNLRVVQGAQWRRRLAFMAEHLDILAHNSLSRRNLFKISTGRFGMRLQDIPEVRQADIVVLNWVNQGTMSLAEINQMLQRGQRIVWVMHDRWCQTSLCHHIPPRCHNLATGCLSCPLLANPRNPLGAKVYRAKQALYAPWPMMTFVAVSHWLAQAPEGALTTGHRVEVIPNVFPTDLFPPHPTLTREQLHLPPGPLVVMGAARLDDPVKDLPLAIRALNATTRPLTAVFFGSVKNPHAFNALKVPYVHLGPVSHPHRVAAFMAHATVVLSTSQFETLPTTLIEGMSAGATPVATATGGQADIIDNGRDGYIAPDRDPQTLAALIAQALRQPFDRQAQHDAAARRFNAHTVARRYLNLFKQILQAPWPNP